MWMMTTLGFYSIVRRGDTFVIRARVKEDLDNLVWGVVAGKYEGGKSCGDTWFGKITETPINDYRWRMTTDRQGIGRVFQAFARSIDYPNFKQEIAETSDQRGKLAAYHRVWDVMASHLGAYGRGPSVDTERWDAIQSECEFDLSFGSESDDDGDGPEDRRD